MLADGVKVEVMHAENTLWFKATDVLQLLRKEESVREVVEHLSELFLTAAVQLAGGPIDKQK